MCPPPLCELTARMSTSCCCCRKTNVPLMEGVCMCVCGSDGARDDRRPFCCPRSLVTPSSRDHHHQSIVLVIAED